MPIEQKDCVEFATLAEIAYRTFLSLLKSELENATVNDISPTQAFVLLNINDNKITMGDIIQKGYYAGSNASYNLKKMYKHGYINQFQSNYDKRTQFINITDKGKQLLDILKPKIQEYAKLLENNTKERINLVKINGNIRTISNQLKSRIVT